MGGGMELALCADLRVASTSTDKLGLPETRLGIIPGAGGTYRMSKLIGPSRTKELVFTARLLNGQQAFDMGIVDRLATSTGQSQSGNGAAFDMSVQLASAMAQNGPVALRAAKAAIDKAQILDTESALDWERACYERCLRTKDRLEGLKAFAEKRKPQYTGE
jgi:methylglutaconyl-CoA hydratase